MIFLSSPAFSTTTHGFLIWQFSKLALGFNEPGFTDLLVSRSVSRLFKRLGGVGDFLFLAGFPGSDSCFPEERVSYLLGWIFFSSFYSTRQVVGLACDPIFDFPCDVFDVIMILLQLLVMSKKVYRKKSL